MENFAVINYTTNKISLLLTTLDIIWRRIWPQTDMTWSFAGHDCPCRQTKWVNCSFRVASQNALGQCPHKYTVMLMLMKVRKYGQIRNKTMLTDCNKIARLLDWILIRYYIIECGLATTQQTRKLYLKNLTLCLFHSEGYLRMVERKRIQMGIVQANLGTDAD